MKGKTFAAGIVVCLLGCGGFNEARQSEQKKVTAPGDAQAKQQAGPRQANGNQAAPAKNQNKKGLFEFEPNAGQGKRSIIGRNTRVILNAKEEVKNGNFVVVPSKTAGKSVYTNVYTKLASFTGTLGIQQWIRHQKVLEDGYPTYVELQAWMKKNPGVNLPVLPAKRLYGYNEDTGEIVLLVARNK